MKEHLNQISYKSLYRILKVVFGLSLLPLLILAFYNYPSADDFSMANEVRMTFVESGSVLRTIGHGIYMGYWYFMNWCGYYFSDFLMATPPSVFGERWYVLSTFLLLGMFILGTWYFLHVLLVKMLHVDKDLAGCFELMVLFLVIQCMPNTSRVEAFYWCAGAVNYFFMFGMGLLYLGVLLRILVAKRDGENGRGRRILRLVLACFLGFAMGGANYMSALSCGIISFLIMLVILLAPMWSKRKSVSELIGEIASCKILILPTMIQLLGLLASCVAPGNHVRGIQDTTNVGPIRSILRSMYYPLEIALGDWTNWAVLCILAIMLPIIWQIAKQIRGISFRYPALMVVFLYGMVCANLTPPIYATGDIEAGRIQAIFWSQYVICLELLLIYLCGWLQRVNTLNQESNGADSEPHSFSKRASRWISYLTVLFLICSGLYLRVNPYFYSGTSAITDLRNGSAKAFAEEWKQRYELFNDPEVKEVVVPRLTVQPEMLYFSDISTDPEDWANVGMCEYFGKELVVSVNPDGE